MHQGYIEPHACVVSVAKDGKTTIWSSSQSHFMVRDMTGQLTGTKLSDIRAYPAEIGGGFGGKTIVYLEPLALVLSRKSGRPVKIVMTREEVFRATGPTSGSSSTVKIGATKDGKITAVHATYRLQAGAFPGSPIRGAVGCALSPYHLDNVLITGFDVVSNRPKVAAYRAPGSPIGAFAVESTLDELAAALKMDPLVLRQKNAAREGTKAAYGPTLGKIGYEDTLRAALEHPHYRAPLKPNQGRGVASGFWFNAGGKSSTTVSVNEDGTVMVVTGHPDIGGSRASMVNIAAELFGIDYRQVQALIGDTSVVEFSAAHRRQPRDLLHSVTPAGPEDVPAEFVSALRSLRRVTVRPEVVLDEVPGSGPHRPLLRCAHRRGAHGPTVRRRRRARVRSVRRPVRPRGAGGLGGPVPAGHARAGDARGRGRRGSAARRGGLDLVHRRAARTRASTRTPPVGPSPGCCRRASAPWSAAPSRPSWRSAPRGPRPTRTSAATSRPGATLLCTAAGLEPLPDGVIAFGPRR